MIKLLLIAITAAITQRAEGRVRFHSTRQGPPQLRYRSTGRMGRLVREVGRGVAVGGVEIAAGGAGVVRVGGNAAVVGAWP